MSDLKVKIEIQLNEEEAEALKAALGWISTDQFWDAGLSPEQTEMNQRLFDLIPIFILE